MFESWYEFWYRLRARFRRDELDSELAEELRAHAAFLEDEARAAGASPDAARRAAAQRLGNRTNIREATRDRWSFGWVDALLQDTRYAFRFLRRSPGFTIVAVLSLALGIGANATVFSVADKLLFSAPAHVANPDGLLRVNVQRTYEKSGPHESSPTSFFSEGYALREQTRAFSAVTLYTPPTNFRMGRGPDAPRFKESLVTPDFFDVLGVQPIRGRFLLPDDDRPDVSEHAAVISYAFWQSKFGGADSAVGARYRASDLDFVIVGIAPKDFTGLELDAADVWASVAAVAPVHIRPDWMASTGTVMAVVRLREGVALATAATEATAILRRLPEIKKFGNVQETVELGSIIKARGPGAQSSAIKVSTKLVMVAAMVLLAACANLANLLLVRALARRREIALRLAIGISRSRLVSQMLLESMLIAVAGALAALLVARWSGDTLRKLVFPDVQWGTNAVNVRMFAFAMLLGTVVAMLATLAPAIRMTRADVANALRSASSHLTASTGRLRQGLLALQVALSVLMIIGASAFSRSLNEAYKFDMGVDVDRVITSRIFLDGDSLSMPERLVLLEEGMRRVRSMPGVERVTIAGSLPLAGNSSASISDPARTGSKIGGGQWDVTPELLRTIGFRLERGRFITDADISRGVRGPVMLTATAARKLWPDADPIGRCARIGADTMPCLTVVGVVKDLRSYSIHDKAISAVLIGVDAPTRLTELGAYIVVRTQSGADMAAVASSIRASLHDIRPNISSIEVRLLTQVLENDYRPLRLGSITIGSFALLAIVLAAIGLYGILSFSVEQRTNEFGIRGALGARSQQILLSVLREGLTVVTVGVIVGMALSWYASTAIAALLFQTSARDAMPYVYAATVLSVVALAASILPAWRATRVDPAIALRAE